MERIPGKNTVLNRPAGTIALASSPRSFALVIDEMGIDQDDEAGGAVRDELRKLLATCLPEFFHPHDHIATFERNMGRGGKLEGRSTGADFLDGEVNRSLTNGEQQRQSHAAEPRIDFFDPLLEALRIERSHVPR